MSLNVAKSTIEYKYLIKLHFSENPKRARKWCFYTYSSHKFFICTRRVIQQLWILLILQENTLSCASSCGNWEFLHDPHLRVYYENWGDCLLFKEYYECLLYFNLKGRHTAIDVLPPYLSRWGLFQFLSFTNVTKRGYILKIK